MAKSRNFQAFTSTNLTGQNLHLTVSGEIDTGNKRKGTLAKRHLQGINPKVLILDAEPINENNSEAFFQPVSYNEPLEDKYKYSNVSIYAANTGEELENLVITHRMS